MGCSNSPKTQSYIRRKNIESNLPNENLDKPLNAKNTHKTLEKRLEENLSIEILKITLNTNLPSPTKWNEDKIRSFGYHKVFLGYLNAYFDHCPIKVSPNVIWQLIVNSFSKYVDNYSEYLRKKFVNFKGKKELKFVRIGRNTSDVYKYKDGIIEELCEKISENVGSEIVDILTPDFSTSTKETIIAGKASIMSTFKKYFKYHGFMCTCGIPYIILEGTIEDWEKILKKLKFLSKYEFYTEKMEKNIEEIIETKKGNINLDFWRHIIMETKENVTVVEKCMDVTKEKNVIRGWICDFYPTLDKNVEANSYNLVKEVNEVPITIEFEETGETKKAEIVAGILDLKQDPKTFIVEPIVKYYFSFHVSHHYI